MAYKGLGTGASIFRDTALAATLAKSQFLTLQFIEDGLIKLWTFAAAGLNEKVNPSEVEEWLAAVRLQIEELKKLIPPEELEKLEKIVANEFIGPEDELSRFLDQAFQLPLSGSLNRSWLQPRP